MSKHTPGPWSVDHGKDPRLVLYEDDDRYRWLAEIHYEGDGSDDWRDLGADLRLIAAAPELLDMLRELVGLVDVLYPDSRLSRGDTMETSRKLLARIDGGEA